MAKVKVRRGMPSVQLDKREFKKRFQAKFYDPVFEPLQAEIDKIADAAWIAYDEYHKTPHTRKVGAGFADPDYEAAVEWLRRAPISRPPSAARKIRNRRRAC